MIHTSFFAKRLPFLTALAGAVLFATLLIGHRIALAAVTYACPDGTGAASTTVIGTTCYGFFDADSTWNEAKTACESFGGTLAIVKNSTVQDTLFAMLDGEDAWLGASDDGSRSPGASEGEYYWLDRSHFWTGGQGGSAVNSAYEAWAGVEPNNDSGNEHCLEMYHTDGLWNDMVCTDPQSYICQRGASVIESSSSSSTESTATGNGGVRSSTLQQRIEASLLRMRAPPNHPAPASNAAPAATGGSSLRDRTCARVLRLANRNPETLRRINQRLEKALGFTCS